jgi:hypothetical protein
MGYNTYGIIREVTKTRAVQENWGRAKTRAPNGISLVPGVSLIFVLIA